MTTTTPMLWSILVPTVPARIRSGQFARCLTMLHDLTYGEPIEVLGLFDNKQRTVAAKRNALLSLAAGRFFSFVDDDDRVAPDYVTRILQTIRAHPAADVIVYDHEVRIDGGPPKRCVYGIEYDYFETDALWTGKPAHTQTWRTDLVRDVPFPDAYNVGEDVAWVKAASTRVQTQIRIDAVLYYYDCSWSTSQTRAAGLVEDVPPARQADWQHRCT